MRVIAALLAFGLLIGLQATPAAALPGETEMPEECVFEEGELGQYIVAFHDWVDNVEAVARDQVERYDGKLGFVYEYALKGYSAEYLPASAEALQAEPTVADVEVDRLIWMDESSGVIQWHSCPLAPPLGPAPPVAPEEPESPEGSERPASSGSPQPLQASSMVSPSAPPVMPCRRVTASKGKRCAARGNRPMRLCNHRAVAGKRRC